MCAAFANSPAYDGGPGITPWKIKLREWESKDFDLPPSAKEELFAVQGEFLSIQLMPNGKSRLTAGPIVGRVRLRSVDLEIAPKTPIPTLLVLLSEVHDLASLLPTLAGYAISPHLVDLLIHAFLRLRVQLRFGEQPTAATIPRCDFPCAPCLSC